MAKQRIVERVRVTSQGREVESISLMRMHIAPQDFGKGRGVGSGRRWPWSVYSLRVDHTVEAYILGAN